VLIEKVAYKIDTPGYVHFGNIYGDSRRGRIVVSMIVFEHHENNNASIRTPAKESLV
jgi:hypothetical protein